MIQLEGRQIPNKNESVPDWIDCPNCSAMRFVRKDNADYGIVKQCGSCGDEEIDLLTEPEI